MNVIPQVDDTTPLIRTDFSDQEAWEALWTVVTTPNEDDFLAHVHLVEDPAYRDLTLEQIAALAPDHSLLVIADKRAITSADHQLLVFHRTAEGHEHLRVIARELWGIESNISVANMDWKDFAENVDPDGVHRGFGDN